jgi:predicted SAM-dependent methyltransferase
MKNIVIDLGCGPHKIPGSFGVDRIPSPNVDLVCDLERFLPLKTDCVDAVHASHLLEHIHNLVGLMEEIYRVCRTGALVDIEVPYFTSRGAFRDPTHVHFISEETFQYFEFPAAYDIKTNFKIEKVEYQYRTFFRYFPRFLQKIFRRHLWNVVDNMRITLEVVK